MILSPGLAGCTFDGTGRGGSGSASEDSDATAADGECGNLELEEGEDCDDGNSEISDGCLPDCRRAVNCKAIKEFDPQADSGVYTLSPDGEAFDVYCQMELDGGGWQLLSVRHETSGILFSNEDCLGLDVTCSGHLRPSQVATGVRELLVATVDGEYWLRVDGLKPAGADGLADFLSLERPLDPQDTCEYPNHCGTALDEDLTVSASSPSWTPRFSTLSAQFFRQGGIWLGSGGGNPPNHVVSLNYGAFCGSAGGLDLSDSQDDALGNVVCGVPGAIYFR